MVSSDDDEPAAAAPAAPPITMDNIVMALATMQQQAAQRDQQLINILERMGDNRTPASGGGNAASTAVTVASQKSTSRASPESLLKTEKTLVDEMIEGTFKYDLTLSCRSNITKFQARLTSPLLINACEFTSWIAYVHDSNMPDRKYLEALAQAISEPQYETKETPSELMNERPTVYSHTNEVTIGYAACMSIKRDLRLMYGYTPVYIVASFAPLHSLLVTGDLIGSANTIKQYFAPPENFAQSQTTEIHLNYFHMNADAIARLDIVPRVYTLGCYNTLLDKLSHGSGGDLSWAAKEPMHLTAHEAYTPDRTILFLFRGSA